MTSQPERIILADASQLAAAAAARLITSVVDAQAARGHAHVVLTGGSNGGALLKAVAASPARDAVDWSQSTSGGATSASSRRAIRNATRRRRASTCSTRSRSTRSGST